MNERKKRRQDDDTLTEVVETVIAVELAEELFDLPSIDFSGGGGDLGGGDFSGGGGDFGGGGADSSW